MRPRLPRPGEDLGSETCLIVVIQRGWSDEKIRAAIAAKADEYGMDGDPLAWPFRLETMHYHTAEQVARDGIGSDYDAYWSPNGWGRSRVDVAVVD